MKREKMKDAFSPVGAGEELRRSVMDMEVEEKRTVQWSGKKVAWRLTSLAAAGLLLLVILSPQQIREEFVTAPGILKVYGCEMEGKTAEELDEFEIVKEKPYGKSRWCPYMNSTPGIYLTMVIPEAEFAGHKVTFDISADYGELTLADLQIGAEVDSSKKKTVNNGQTLIWTGRELRMLLGTEVESYPEAMRKLGPIYVEIIARAGDQIVGYVVFEIEHAQPWEPLETKEEIAAWEEIPIFSMKLIGNESYPLVDGQFQNITEEYILEQIEICKRIH